jgi:mycoredoxin-dependent peroxiredoxin
MPVEVGSPAPDFTLRDESGEEVTLSSLRGQNVVLIFYPFAFSSICTKELRDMTGLEDKYGEAKVYGVSVDSPFALKAFRKHEGLAPHLLSDFEPKGAVAQEYGAYLDGLGFATRATFVIDKDGNVARSMLGIKPAGHAANVLESLPA